MTNYSTHNRKVIKLILSKRVSFKHPDNDTIKNFAQNATNSLNRYSGIIYTILSRMYPDTMVHTKLSQRTLRNLIFRTNIKNTKVITDNVDKFISTYEVFRDGINKNGNYRTESDKKTISICVYKFIRMIVGLDDDGYYEHINYKVDKKLVDKEAKLAKSKKLDNINNSGVTSRSDITSKYKKVLSDLETEFDKLLSEFVWYIHPDIYNDFIEQQNNDTIMEYIIKLISSENSAINSSILKTPIHTDKLKSKFSREFMRFYGYRSSKVKLDIDGNRVKYDTARIPNSKRYYNEYSGARNMYNTLYDIIMVMMELSLPQNVSLRGEISLLRWYGPTPNIKKDTKINYLYKHNGNNDVLKGLVSTDTTPAGYYLIRNTYKTKSKYGRHAIYIGDVSKLIKYLKMFRFMNPTNYIFVTRTILTNYYKNLDTDTPKNKLNIITEESCTGAYNNRIRKLLNGLNKNSKRSIEITNIVSNNIDFTNSDVSNSAISRKVSYIIDADGKKIDN